MAQADTLEIVSFAAGAYRLAVEAQQIDALLNDGPETLVAVETLLGLPLVEAGPRRCLRVGKYRVSVSEPVDLRALSVDSIYPLPELVARRIQIRGVRALVIEAHEAMLLLDLRGLLSAAMGCR